MKQWTGSQAVLSDLLGEPIPSASVSDGYYSIKVGQAAAASGLKFLFTSEPTANVETVDGCSILGRYAVLSTTKPEAAASLALGEAGAHLRQALSWKAIPKTPKPHSYKKR